MAGIFGDDRDHPIELIAEAMRVTGRLIADVDREAAKAHFERAAQACATVGNQAAFNEVARDVFDTLGEPLSLRARTTLTKPGTAAQDSVRRELTQPARRAVSSLTERLVATIEFAVFPPLLARELFSLVVDTQATARAAVVMTQDGQRRELFATVDASGLLAIDAHPEAVRIHLGSHHRCSYEVVAWPLPNSAARTTILAIQRLARSALAVARARLLERERADLWPEPTPEQELGLICVSERMLELINTIRRVGDSNVTVLLTGETGVGKELFARALHKASARSDRSLHALQLRDGGSRDVRQPVVRSQARLVHRRDR